MNTQQDHEISNIKSSSEPVLSVGQTLREARERMGLSANDVANRIKFATKQIEWLEADDYIRLPEAAFVRGFVRSYARLLELDAAQLLTGLPSSHVRTSSIPEVKSVDIPLPSTLNGRRHNIIWLAAALIIAVSVAVFERMHSRSPDQPQVGETPTVQVLDLPVEAGVNDAPMLTALSENTTPDPERVPEVLQIAKPELVAETAVKPVVVKQAESVAPVVVPKKSVGQLPTLQNLIPQQPAGAVAVSATPKPVVRAVPSASTSAAPAPAVTSKKVVAAAGDSSIVTAEGAAAEHSIRLEFDEDAWVEVKDGSDNLLVSKLHTAGSLVRVKGKSPLLVVIGNAHAVRLFENGKKIKLEKYTTADVARVKLK